MSATAAGRLLVVLAIVALSADEAGAQTLPKPGIKPGGFWLLARANGALTVNRVSCSINASGQICHDPTGATLGGFWPRGTANNYVFSSGFQIAGIVGGDPSFDWQGDTTGASFYAGTGKVHGDPVRLIHNSADPEDLANWPNAARVPDEDTDANPFNRLLRGGVNAAQADVWWLTWDGNPALNEERPHPLGVLLEQRGLGWNFPAGNEDILYFVFTVHNITSTDPADYIGTRPALRDILLEKAAEFQALNEKEFEVALPDGGYPIEDAYVAFGADMDVGQFNLNYASVNVPFALGYTYDHRFAQQPGWSFDPEIFGPPFFPGIGFVGVKHLAGPRDSLGRELGITNFSGYEGLGVFGEPFGMPQIYRFLSGRLDPNAGDPQCNTGNPAVTHICFINQGFPSDMRFFQSTGPLTIPPGGSASVAVAYIFAAPVRVRSCTPPCDIRPGDPTILGDAARMASGANVVDSMTGYAGFADGNVDGRVEQSEFRVVPGSLLGKALVAQAVFDSGFLLPFAPEAPPFYLIPGDGQVTILWQPSGTETSGDPFFANAASPTVPPLGGRAPVPNPLYDPNYRQYDVEGYRVYRGRVDSPNSLRLLAQFDYAGSLIPDYQGQVNPVPTCAPELGIDAPLDPATGVDPCDFDVVTPGVARTKHVDVPLVGPIIQIRLGRRVRLADGRALLIEADTAVTGAASGCLRSGSNEECALRDTGVPFVYVDRTPRNNFRYFYTVTAFDINSIQSGPSSLESPRTTKSVTPVTAASNYQNTANVVVSMQGRGVVLNSAAPTPTLDPATGRFSGPFPPANDFEFGLAEFVQTLLAAPGSFSLTLDSIGLGSAYDNIPNRYYFTGASGATVTQVTLPITQDQTSVTNNNFTFFTAISPDAALAQRFGGSDQFKLTARILMNLRGNYFTSAYGLGCVNAATFSAALGFRGAGTTGCEYNGQRWFDGPSPAENETVDDPQATHPVNSTTNLMVPAGNYNNAGAVTGATTVHIPHSYETQQNTYRQVEGALGGVQRSADFNVYWGAAGLIDSVIDVTHNVVVPFALTIGSSFGVLNQAAGAAGGSLDSRPGVLTAADMGCVSPWITFPQVGAGGVYNCTAAAPYVLSQTAVPGPVAIYDGSTANAATKAPQAGPGFILYLPGTYTVFESPVPAQGAVWTLRSYVGAIRGGQGAAGDRGPYIFTARPRPLTATGVTLQVDYDVVNQVVSATASDLSRVHTVPDPYYVTNAFERATESKVIQFVHLPQQAIIRIYSSSGVLVTLLEHRSDTFGGAATWNVQNRNNHVVASGVYFYHIESGGARRVGRLTVVNFAE